jgi:hypothetical protein
MTNLSDRDCKNCIHKVPYLRDDGTWGAECESWNCEFLSRKACIDALKQLETANCNTFERPKGKIIIDYLPYVDNDGVSRIFQRYVCSECKEGVTSIAKFCPWCGVKFNSTEESVK